MHPQSIGTGPDMRRSQIQRKIDIARAGRCIGRIRYVGRRRYFRYSRATCLIVRVLMKSAYASLNSCAITDIIHFRVAARHVVSGQLQFKKAKHLVVRHLAKVVYQFIRPYVNRKLSNKRIFPAVDIVASSTRRDDLLLRPETLQRMWILRRYLSDRTSIEAMECYIDSYIIDKIISVRYMFCGAACP